jgi:nucleotide-binding universal stress UspA family protein
MAVKRILVPVDFSKDSLRALAYAGDLAKSFGAELRLLHVVDQTYLANAPEFSFANPKLAKLLEEQWQAAQAQMIRIGADLGKKRQRVRILMKGGSPAQVIADTARSSAADLIVMGTHGRTGLAHMLIGSVAERVVRIASCPVLTVRHGTSKQRPPKKAVRRRTA